MQKKVVHKDMESSIPLLFVKNREPDIRDMYEYSENRYANLTEMKLVILKNERHTPDFKTVMNNFNIEMVWKKSKFTQLLILTYSSQISYSLLHFYFAFLLFIQKYLFWILDISFQIMQDRIQAPYGKRIRERVFGRCKKCGLHVGEIRFFEDDEKQKLTSILWCSNGEISDSKTSILFGCAAFENHKCQQTINFI